MIDLWKYYSLLCTVNCQDAVKLPWMGMFQIGFQSSTARVNLIWSDRRIEIRSLIAIAMHDATSTEYTLHRVHSVLTLYTAWLPPCLPVSPVGREMSVDHSSDGSVWNSPDPCDLCTSFSLFFFPPLVPTEPNE